MHSRAAGGPVIIFAEKKSLRAPGYFKTGVKGTYSCSPAWTFLLLTFSALTFYAPLAGRELHAHGIVHLWVWELCCSSSNSVSAFIPKSCIDSFWISNCAVSATFHNPTYYYQKGSRFSGASSCPGKSPRSPHSKPSVAPYGFSAHLLFCPGAKQPAPPGLNSDWLFTHNIWLFGLWLSFPHPHPGFCPVDSSIVARIYTLFHSPGPLPVKGGIPQLVLISQLVTLIQLSICIPANMSLY